LILSYLLIANMQCRRSAAAVVSLWVDAC